MTNDNDIPKFLTEAIEARDEGHSFEDIVLCVYAIGAGRGLRIGREQGSEALEEYKKVMEQRDASK